MCLRILCWCAALFASIFPGAAILEAQSAAEYGMATGNSAAAVSSGKALVPFPNTNLPGSSASSSSTSASAGGPEGTAKSAAKGNMEFLQSHSGPNAVAVTVHTEPEHASVWIDGKFLGPSPVNLKLAPGHHQLLVRAPNMKESARPLELAAKQTQTVVVALQPSHQNQVVIHWPPQK